MPDPDPYKDFTSRLKLLVGKHPELIVTTLSNIFTMRLIGNKTHGDLAEIAIAEFINQYMYDFSSIHVGKDLYRAKSKEEDITVTNELSGHSFPVSLKAYGDGPLQLSTDKSFRMFPRLESEAMPITDRELIRTILQDPAFSDFRSVNVMPLIYDEKKQKCNVMVFDYTQAEQSCSSIIREDGVGRRKHPVYKFLDSNDQYICEVRYGDAAANALQRGLWTHTRHGLRYFDSITDGWIDYSHNQVLVQLFSHALVSSSSGHSTALVEIKNDIKRIQQEQGLHG